MGGSLAIRSVEDYGVQRGGIHVDVDSGGAAVVIIDVDGITLSGPGGCAREDYEEKREERAKEGYLFHGFGFGVGCFGAGSKR